MDWTIGRRIATGFAILLSLVLLVAAVGAIALTTTTRASEAALRQHRAIVAAALNARDEFSRANLDYLFFLLRSDERWARSRDSTLALARERVAALRDSSEVGEHRQAWETAARLLDRWDDAVRASMQAAQGGRLDEALRIRDARVAAVRDSLRAIFLQETAAAERAADAYTGDARSAMRRSWIALLTTGVLALIIGIIAAVLLNRAVTNPLRETSSVLASSTAEILAATSQQASGASESSAAVTETVATIDEVAQTAEQSVQRARAVSDMAQRATEIAKTGRTAVEGSVTGMATVKEQVESIAESIMALAEQAQAIGEITATVSDIAEQTNLLALNAAVEAARAGEHGRGFAVVAGEIRSLADQSKRATVQVRQILGEIQRATSAAVMTTEQGTKEVTAGSKQVTEAGETIRALAEAVAQSSQAAAQIVASAGQQATGMVQIRQAMANIHEATQQNLASSKQAEQAAQDLNRLGARLLALTGTNGRPPAR